MKNFQNNLLTGSVFIMGSLFARLENSREYMQDVQVHGQQGSDISPDHFLRQEALAVRNPFIIPKTCPVAALDSKGQFLNPDQKCDFYDCAAKEAVTKKVCADKDPSAYFIEYGKKYCERFSSEAMNSLSLRGKAWLRNTLACLQSKIFSGCNAEAKCFDCRSIHDLAFGTHPECYVDSGLCFLSLEDQQKIALTVDFKDLATKDSAIQVTKSISLCTGLHMRKLDKGILALNKSDPIKRVLNGEGADFSFQKWQAGAVDYQKTQREKDISKNMGIEPRAVQYMPRESPNTQGKEVQWTVQDGEVLEVIANSDGTFSVY